MGKSAGPSTISVLAIGLSSKVAADRQILASAEWRDHVLDEWTILTGDRAKTVRKTLALFAPSSFRVLPRPRLV